MRDFHKESVLSDNHYYFCHKMLLPAMMPLVFNAKTREVETEESRIQGQAFQIT